VVRVQKIQKSQKKQGKLMVLTETHPVAVAMGWHSLMGITIGRCSTDLSKDDDTSWAPVDAKCATGTNIIVDKEHRVVTGVFSGKFGANSLIDRGSADKVDALPRANIDASFAGNALGLVNMNELLGLYRL
jgi:hypothetical protein